MPKIILPQIDNHLHSPEYNLDVVKRHLTNVQQTLNELNSERLQIDKSILTAKHELTKWKSIQNKKELELFGQLLSKYANHCYYNEGSTQHKIVIPIQYFTSDSLMSYESEYFVVGFVLLWKSDLSDIQIRKLYPTTNKQQISHQLFFSNNLKWQTIPYHKQAIKMYNTFLSIVNDDVKFYCKSIPSETLVKLILRLL